MHIVPNYIHKFFIINFLMLFNLFANAQNDLAFYQEQLAINEALYPPEDILSASSLVLFSVAEDVETSEWKEKLTELQVFFASQGIDAVAYVNVTSLYNIPGEATGVPQVLRAREIKNLILFHYQGEEKNMLIAMGPLSDQQNFWTKGDTFWIRVTSSLDPVFTELDTYFRTGARARTNLLVNDRPEFFQPQPENDRIILTAAPRIRPNYKVALKNWDLDFYLGFGAHKLLDNHLKAPEIYAAQWQARHDLFSSIALDTTNIVEFVEPELIDRELQRLSFDYELAALFGNHEQLSEFFKTDEPMPSFEGERLVFYMKSLGSNTIYLPKEWQPEKDWSDALSGLLDAFRTSLYPASSE